MGDLAWTDLRASPAGPVVWVGRHRSARPVAIPGHRLAVWQACVVVTGRLPVTIDGEVHLIPGGRWLLVPPGSELRSTDPRCRGLFYWIGLDPSAMSLLTRVAQSRLVAMLRTVSGVVHDGAERIRRQADAVIAAHGESEWGACAAGLGLVACLTPAGINRDEGVASALAAMRSDPARDWTVEELARLCRLRPSRFHARFRSEIGKTPHAALVELRLQAASRMIVSGADLVQVAREAGFATRRGFERAFRLQFGVAPGRWRGVTRNGVSVAFES